MTALSLLATQLINMRSSSTAHKLGSLLVPMNSNSFTGRRGILTATPATAKTGPNATDEGFKEKKKIAKKTTKQIKITIHLMILN